jgi:hypothetical protein
VTAVAMRLAPSDLLEAMERFRNLMQRREPALWREALRAGPGIDDVARFVAERFDAPAREGESLVSLLERLAGVLAARPVLLGPSPVPTVLRFGRRSGGVR